VAQEIEQLLLSFKADRDTAQKPQPVRPATEEDLKKLRALGYLDTETSRSHPAEPERPKPE
jgi:hypothetical protein